ncbi:class I SAM-dependent methyltransferase [Bacillus sp. SD075]|uniref:class I SAM-dependent methyltransferase n=1 Tax=Bacillus sp. SD075 TaxID=2781732 RepID=UPI001A968CFC|nr:class I SAM-dependent methyltransferase [Bacillus sp. SD075]MBO1000499.1 class I SAM-dependent methyltransferase [Bacillus sp. SD075]
MLGIGCGTRRITFTLYRGYQNITGIGLPSAMLYTTEEIAQEYNLDTPFNLGDAADLPLKVASFDKKTFALMD